MLLAYIDFYQTNKPYEEGQPEQIQMYTSIPSKRKREESHTLTFLSNPLDTRTSSEMRTSEEGGLLCGFSRTYKFEKV